MKHRLLRRSESIVSITQSEIMLALAAIIALLLALMGDRITEALKVANLAQEPNRQTIAEQQAAIEPSKENIEQLGVQAAIGRAAMDALDIETPDPDDPESIRRAIAEVQGQMQGGGAKADAGDLVGFDPCWPREGARKYYFAYHLEHDPQTGLYSMEAHAELERGLSLVPEVQGGALRRALLSHPTDRMQESELLALGGRIERALQDLRGRYGDHYYVEGCLLAVTINADTYNYISEMVRTKVLLYPVTR